MHRGEMTCPGAHSLQWGWDVTPRHCSVHYTALPLLGLCCLYAPSGQSLGFLSHIPNTIMFNKYSSSKSKGKGTAFSVLSEARVRDPSSCSRRLRQVRFLRWPCCPSLRRLWTQSSPLLRVTLVWGWFGGILGRSGCRADP